MGALLLLGVDVVKERLIGLSGTKILLFLIKVYFHCEGGGGRYLEMRLAERPDHDVK